MGRKAKLKKQRRQAQQNKADLAPSEELDFIGQMKKEGYHLDRIKRSPEVPREENEPQI